MSVRTSWSARKDRRSDSTDQADEGAMPLDDILDARFDEEGRLARIGRGQTQRTAERLDPRPPAISAEELERAVRKLARGLESIERQGGAALPQPPRQSPPAEQAGSPPAREFVTHSLDRLEARLEALSRRLEQRAGTTPAQSSAERRHAELGQAHAGSLRPSLDDWDAEPSFAGESRRAAEAGPFERHRSKAALADHGAAAAEEAERRRGAAAAEAERRAKLEEAEHRAKLAEAEHRAKLAEAEHRAKQEEIERRARLEEAERRAEAAEAARRAEAVRQAEENAEMKRQLAMLAARVEELQDNGDEEQTEALRRDLQELVHHIEDVGRDGRLIAAAVEQIRARLEALEPKVNAARNMAGNRLGELQDRLSGLTERIGDMEAEIPGFDAVRENQTAILERFDRIEGIVQRLATPDDLSARVDGLRGDLQSAASQSDVVRIGEQIVELAERLDSLPQRLSDRDSVKRMEAQLQTLVAEFSEARRRSEAGTAQLDRHLSELSAALEGIGEAERAADLSSIDGRLAELAARLDEDRRSNGVLLDRLDKRLAGLAAAVDKQESEAAAELLTGLTQRMDALARAIDAQDARGARRDLEGLDRKLDQMSRMLADQSEHFSRGELQPLADRLDQMQAQLEAIAQSHATAEQLGPFAQKLHEIAERVASLDLSGMDSSPVATRLALIEERIAGLPGRGPDSRALNNQLEGIVSRLEVLKGRSVDPARLNELLDRIAAAAQGGVAEDRLERIERKLAELRGIGEEQLAGLEQKLAAGAAGGLAEERFARLERKLDDFGAAIGVGPDVLTQEDLAELRNDIVALRRELRSLPGLGDGESNLSNVLKTIAERLDRLPGEAPATTAELEAQIDRIAQLLEDPTHSRLALAHIEASLHAITERLDETRRTILHRGVDRDDGTDVAGIADLARSLSDDVTVLRGATEASERSTKDALEAVQDTLEAVVKRMAFLERDAEPSAGAAAAAGSARTSGAAATSGIVESPAAPPAAPRESGSGGLFSRLTSSQLLRRATGGRADSFSPEGEDGDEPDLPLEPGTNAPLNSALSGAPSSDTALMTGDRARARVGQGGRGADIDVDRARRSSAETGAGDDFLSAARRAAQAAAAEVAQAEREAQQSRESSGVGRILGLVKGRRRMLLASALAVAIAFAAFQIVRGIIAADDAVVAAGPTPVRTEQAPGGAQDRTAENADIAAGSGFVEAPPASSSAAGAVSPEMPAGAPSVPPAETLAADDGAPAPLGEAAAESPRATASLPARATELPQQATPIPAASLPPGIGPARLRDAALAGDSVAAFEVAARYAEGRGVGQDLGAALAWYEFAGEKGLAPAQYRLGSIYEKGLGVAKDPIKAQDWYRRAADAGNVKAMHNLAVLYAEGAGGEPDLERAAALFRQAAEHGVRDSQFNLAILHARGLGVPQDMVEAYKWFAVAAQSGDAESVKRRDIIGEALSKADLAKAQAAAEAFKPLPLKSEANDVVAPSGGWGEETTGVAVPSDNELVALVQKLLMERGFDPGPADGLLGQQTIQAIGAFQEQAGLPTTGQIDADLVAALAGEST